MKDTPRKIEKIQFEMMMKKSPNERIAMGCEMFMAARQLIFASMPKDLSEKDKKRLFYRKMYGESLPEDFFKDEK